MSTADGQICNCCMGSGEVEAGYFGSDGSWVFGGYRPCARCDGFGFLRERIVIEDDDESQDDQVKDDTSGEEDPPPT